MNILNNLDKRYDKYANIKHATVLTIDVTNRTCDCIGTDNETVYVNVNYNPAFLATQNFVAPTVNSKVLIALLDEDTPILLSVSNPSTYNVTTVDENGEILENLKNVLDKNIEYLNVFKDDLKNNIQKATWSSPMGVTVATPINWADFENTFKKFEDNMNDIQNRFNNIFS